MFNDLGRKSCSLCFPVVEIAREKLSDTRFGTCSNCFCLENLATLFIQRKIWLELLKDYYLIIDYHPGKTNIVADSLSQKSLFSLKALNKHLTHVVDGFILQKIHEAQKNDLDLFAKGEQVGKLQDIDFHIGVDDSLYF
ncbi:integrase [Gossypium australe]|uniref:Integrase n=1 Tax=Gossypium australe TaxID=47621 RepID=A0A5B6WHU2_9ROSI|nr:integrase [Gossypium australe]